MSDPYTFDSSLVQFEGRLYMDHHNDAEFLATRGTEGFAEGRGTCESHVIHSEAADQALMSLPFPALK